MADGSGPTVMVDVASKGAVTEALPAWVEEPDGWSWLRIFSIAVQICHASPPKQRMWIANVYVITAHGMNILVNRSYIVVENHGRGYVTEDEAKRAALEYLIPRLQRDLVAIDGLLEQLPQAQQE